MLVTVLQTARLSHSEISGSKEYFIGKYADQDRDVIQDSDTIIRNVSKKDELGGLITVNTKDSVKAAAGI